MSHNVLNVYLTNSGIQLVQTNTTTKKYVSIMFFVTPAPVAYGDAEDR
jgi:hypothetical protein